MAKRPRTKSAARSGGLRWVYVVIAVLALAGLADATYLTVMALTGETSICGNASGCFEVLGSKYAKVGPVPLGAFGVIAYFTAFSLATLSAFGGTAARKYLRWLVWAMFAVTLCLLGLQAFVLHAFCRFCLFSAAVVLLMTGLVVATPASGD